MNTLWQDLRYGARMLLKNPGFTLIAVITLALGIGANTAIFSVVNGVLLRPLPYADPDRLVQVWETRPREGDYEFSASPPNFVDWRNQSQSYEQMAAYRWEAFNLTGGDQPERLVGARVSASFFAALGIKSVLGRVFLPEEEQAGRDRVAVMSHRVWQSRFGSDPHVIGRTLTLNGESFTVVGVAPPGFQFPERAEMWVPLAFTAEELNQRGSHFLWVIARLKPNVTLAQAQAEMTTIARRLEQQYPDTNTGQGVRLVRLHEQIVGQVRQALLVLLAAVGFVLLIACANVAN
jgi:putative ABC transport system permease protein